MRDEDRGSAVLGETAHELEQLARHDSVKARCRLIEDDELQGQVRDGEGPCDLDHLPLRERQVTDDVLRGDPVTWEDRIETPADQSAGIATPTQATQVRM